MIKFSNGHQMDFACASGALGFRGEGWWFEKPWHWLGVIDPYETTIIAKTLTAAPRKGNYVWWKPWTCIAYLGDGSFANAFGLTNPGLPHWIENDYPYIKEKGYKVIASVLPESIKEARFMAQDLNGCKNLVGVEVNLSCPNVPHNEQVDYMVDLVKEFAKTSNHPTIAKIGIQFPFIDLCKRLDGVVESIDAINAPPWAKVYDGYRSPLANLGGGAISGQKIKSISRQALTDLKAAGIKTPIISGGGIDSYKETRWRFDNGAGAVTFGVVYVTKPNLPSRIIREWRKKHA